MPSRNIDAKRKGLLAKKFICAKLLLRLLMKINVTPLRGVLPPTKDRALFVLGVLTSSPVLRGAPLLLALLAWGVLAPRSLTTTNLHGMTLRLLSRNFRRRP